MPSIRGSTLRTRRDFVQKYHGQSAWAGVYAALSEADRRTCDGSIVPTSWYPFDVSTRLERAIVDACADGDERICLDIGAFSAAENLATLYRTFLGDGEDPGPFYSRFERIFPTLYDFGSMSVARARSRNEIHVVFDYQGFATRTNCLTTIGFLRGAGVSVAIPRLRVEEKWCQARGQSSCFVIVQWGESGDRRSGIR